MNSVCDNSVSVYRDTQSRVHSAYTMNFVQSDAFVSTSTSNLHLGIFQPVRKLSRLGGREEEARGHLSSCLIFYEMKSLKSILYDREIRAVT